MIQLQTTFGKQGVHKYIFMNLLAQYHPVTNANKMLTHIQEVTFQNYILNHYQSDKNLK